MTFARLLSEATAGELPRTGDVVAVGLPLLVDIDRLHHQNLVTGASGVSAIEYDGERLRVTTAQPIGEQANRRAVDAIAAQQARTGLTVAGRHHHDLGDGLGYGAMTSLDVIDADAGRPERAVFVRDYRVWEQLHGHHDQLTDIALAGLWLCSYAFGLDLDTPEGMNELVRHHRHPSRLNPHLHPVVAGALVSMITPERARRPADMAHVVSRIEHHRDIPADLDLSAAYLPDTDWRRSVLTTLRDRVFDTTRRNRELHYRHTSTSVSLTEASVPLMLNVDRIKPKDLLTWTEPANKPVRKGEVDLATWCRFEETPYLAPALDKLISAERKMRVETGHGRLRLIIAFLHWHDPENDESIVSPLLTLPAGLSRKKGVNRRYRLAVPDDPATVNPVLRHVFASRFDIKLPATCETSPEGINAFVDELERMVRTSAPAVEIETLDKPRIDLIRRRAQLRVDTYRRRRARTLASSGRWRRQDHSYDLDDWRPLGHALYARFVRPTDLPLRDVAGAPPRPRIQALDAATDDAPGVRTSEQYSLRSNDASADRWQVDLCSVTLAMLGSRRTNLARDYDEVLAGSAVDVTATPFEPLFRPEPALSSTEPTVPIHPRQGLVLPADDAQARAVQRAVRGDSFIIQGPPGTGKSQTITNVIAGLVAEGKRVLFVCEKRAAIDVVAHRLDQVGLSDLTATIHDSQLDRKEFVKELGGTYHDWLDALPQPVEDETGESAPVLANPVEAERDQLLRQIDNALRPLASLVGELGRDMGAGISVADAVERVAAIEARLPADDLAVDGPGIPTSHWIELRPALDRVQDALATAGSPGPLGGHDALRVSPEVLAGVDGIETCRTLGRSLGELVHELDPALTVDEVAAAGAWAGPLTATARVGALASLDPAAPQHLDLRAAAQRQADVHADASAKSAVLARWTNPLSAADTSAGLELARSKEGSFFSFLNGRWRALRTLVESSYAFEQHRVKPTITSVLEELQAHHDAVATMEALHQSNTQQFGSPDAGALRAVVDDAHGQPLFAALVASGTQLQPKFDQLRSIDAHSRQLLLGPGTTLAELGRLAASLEGTPVALEPALVAWSAVTADDPAALVALLDAHTSLDAVEVGILRSELTSWQQAVDHQAFTGTRVDDAITTIADLHDQLLDANARVVVERVQAAFHANIAHSNASMAGRSDDDKARKKAYNAARRIVEREAEKKMRHRSIREMAGGESGPVVRDLRPIWLMSPLSVSDTLPLDADLFDVVIFDEASQIPVEDAMPSVFRAPQVIVVGDRMQMPPTRFFSAEDDEESELIVDEHGHRLSISLDADSFLTQADLALDSSLLNWHYRSRYESLIAYSNHSFYGGRLATIPDNVLAGGDRPEITATGSDDAAANAGEVLERPISFHFLEHGEYRDRRNVPEADYVAELVRSLLRRRTGQTIGVVAFSEAQQGAIESSLDELAAVDPEFAELYEEELNRMDDGEFVGLFVKNLENVQGDERDLILMSVCYGPDPNGRIRMNFGPINNAGGERRLNVIFSRARQHMAIVSSMHGNDITNLHNEGASHLAGFLTYAAAESRGETEVATALLRSRVVAADGNVVATSPVANALATALRDKGWNTEVAVGRSDFRVDVAIAIDGEYRVGVLLEPDDGMEANGAAGRYIAEAGVLKAFGWPIVRLPLSDWLADPVRVVDRIDAVARAAG